MYPYYYRTNVSQANIVATAQGDVTGDGASDRVYLTGTKVPNSPYIQDITLVVQDGRTGAYSSVKLPENAGYNPTLFLGDFTGEGTSDILISIGTGGSGAIMYHFIYSFKGNKAKLLFNSNVYNNQYQYKVTFLDQYKVKVKSEANQQVYIIDLTLKGKEYLNEIYDPNGKLKSPIEGFVNPLSALLPVDINSNKVLELVAYQKIAGRYNADSLGYIQNMLSWNKEQFKLENQFVAIFGA